MNSKISALIDGELPQHEAGGAFDALRGDGDARDTWRAYHLIGDSMRAAPLLSQDFSARVAARLAGEPTVLAPLPLPLRKPVLEQRRWQLLSAAASIAAVAFVSFAYFSQEPVPAAAPLAVVAPQAEPAEAAAQVAPPDAANDYLLAHQGYSPRNSLQGMAPYVRTVSSEARGSRR